MMKDCVDVMPDEGWYHFPHPKKKMVYRDYVRDCHDNPHMYILVKKPYFNYIW